jgi:hypothetical protein
MLSKPISSRRSRLELGRRRSREMTDEAKEILSVAAAEHEYIRFVQTLAGTTSIGTGGKGFIPPGAGKRTVTRWINALEELEQAGLIRPTNPGGRLFQVTPEGEAAADRLKAEDQRQPG